MAKRKKSKKKNRGVKKRKTEAAFVLDDKCDNCPAMCCRYIALEIDEPEDAEDWDNLRWYLLHQNVSIYVTDGDWHLCIDVPCRYLKRNRCTIHESKPLLCRRHDPEECEFANPDYELDLEFRSWEDLKAHMKEKGLSGLIVAK